MKTNFIFVMMICLAPGFSSAQSQQTEIFDRVIDSLLAICDKSPNLNMAIQAGTMAKDSVQAYFGKENIRFAKCVASLGIAHRKLGKMKEAEGYLLEAKTLYEQLNHQGSQEFASILSHLGVVNAIFERPAIAETYMVDAKNMFEKITGKESGDYANSTYNLALFYYNTGKYDKAGPLFQEAVEIQASVSGKENTNYALYLNGFANYYIGIGQYERAEPLSLEAKEIRARVLGTDHTDYVLSLASLGNLYRLSGHYKKAEAYYQEVIVFRGKKLGKEHPDYATALNNLGTLYTQAGHYENAEPLMLEAKDIREKKLGKESQGYATSANLLAALYQYTGQYAKSESLYLEVIAIREKMLGKQHSTYALSLNNLATLYTEMGEYTKALPLCIESKAVREASFGKEHPDYAASVMNLANVYKNMNRYPEAETLYMEAKEIGVRVWGEKHPEYAEVLSNLANLYTETGQFGKAAPLYLACKRIQTDALGTQNPAYAKNLGSYARMLFISKEKTEAIAVEREFISLKQQILAQASHFLSEQEMNFYANLYSKTLSNNLSYVQLYSNKPDALPEIGFDNVLFFKGFVLSSISQLKKIALSDAHTASQYNLLVAYHRRLSAEYAKPTKDQKGVAELEEKANTIEKEIARNIAGYGQASRQVKWQEVQASLNPGETVVEFVHYQYYAPYATDSIMYAALLLRPGDTQPQFIPLFEEKQLSPLLRGASGGGNFMKINKLYNQNTLYDLLWKPLEPLLTETNTIYYSPSGLLHRINLAAIATPEGKPYGDRRQLIALGSTRQLVVNSNSNQTNTNTAYLAGGIRYNTDSTSVTYASRGASTRSTEPGVLTFHPDSLSISRGEALDYLPATVAEVQEIGQMIKANGFQSKVDTGFYASEESFRQLGVDSPSPRIIHLATHGYFFPDPDTRLRKAGIEGEPVFKMSDHPMIRSGLIMAGAEQAWFTGQHPEGREDGILTAYEISRMNLSGTELVVLSACETGLGDIVGNEGVYGLQRAFKIAGAKYLIMSLWKVDDQSTRAFMTSFYRHWLVEKQTVPEAFRSTQQEMRNKYSEPYDWAGFVLIE